MFSSQLILTLLQVIAMTTIFYFTLQQVKIVDQQREIVFIRHGARSPNKYTELDSKLWKDFKPGYLTQKGFLQLIIQGQKYSQTSMQDEKKNCDYKKLNIVSSTKPRVVHSTIGFIQGLCSGNYQEILQQYFQDYFKQYSTNEKVLESALFDNFVNPLLFDFDTLKMENDFLFHGHDSEVCPILGEIKAQIMADDEYILANDQFKKRIEFQEIFTQMKIATSSLEQSQVTINKMKTFYGGYKCNSANGFKLPQFTKQGINYLEEIFIYKFYKIDNTDRRQHLAALTKIIQWTINQLNGDYQYSFYIGHDSNQVAILSVLIDQKLIPPFASKLSFVLNGDYVNLMFQNEILETKMCEAKVNCTKRQVISYLSQYISTNLEQLCNPQ